MSEAGAAASLCNLTAVTNAAQCMIDHVADSDSRNQSPGFTFS